MSEKQQPAPPGKKWIYVRYITNWKTGARIYPRKGTVFRFLVNK